MIRNGEKTVTMMYKDGTLLKSRDEKLVVREFEVEPARVRCSLGLTLNLGNFESLRIETGVDIPCYLEEVEQAQKFCYKTAENELSRIKGEAQKNL